MPRLPAKLEAACHGDRQSADDYEWMILELYDQATREFSGGEMARFRAGIHCSTKHSSAEGGRTGPGHGRRGARSAGQRPLDGEQHAGC